MTTLVGTQKHLTELLQQIIELEFDAVRAYDAAVERLSEPDMKAQLSAFMSDHERHVVELTAVLEDMGVPAPKGPDIKQVLTKGKVVIASLAGDRAILLAMKSNEDDTNTAYERATTHRDLSDALRELLVFNLGDERRHRAWIEQRIAADKVISPG